MHPRDAYFLFIKRIHNKEILAKLCMRWYNYDEAGEFFMKKFILYSNLDKDPNSQIAGKVKEALFKLGAEVTEDVTIAEAMIVLGGDGTLLHSIHSIKDIPVFGINLGTLGFLTEFDAGDLSFLEKIVNDEYIIEKRMMLEGRIAGGEPFYALNDIVLSRGGAARVMNIKILVDGCSADTYRADGIIAATPTGSTAYSLSAGGPIIEPDMKLIEITPICPHMMHSRSLIISPEKSVKIILEKKDGAYLNVSADGIGISEITGGVAVDICASSKTVDFIRLKDRQFFDVLNKKQELR